MRRNLPHYTYEDYCHWEGRWELIDGIPYAMSPLARQSHQIIGGNLFSIFKQELRGKSCFACPPMDWLVKDDTVLQPDFLVICGPNSDDGPLAFPPALVAEILSPSTAIKDCNDKFDIYEAQKVKYYLILDARTKKLEVYELIDNKYELVSVNLSLFDFIFHDDCVVTVSFDEVWDLR